MSNLKEALLEVSIEEEVELRGMGLTMVCFGSAFKEHFLQKERFDEGRRRG